MRRVVHILAIGLAVLAAAAQDRGRNGATVSWGPRLEALAPSQPMAYFELAEEIADAASDNAQRQMAVHLFGLAGVLDPPRLGRSACLALADLATDAVARARYQALATLLDRRGGVRAGALGSNGAVDRTAALAVAEALAYYRRGLGPKALTALKRPGAMALLEAHGEALRGGVERFVADCKLYRGQSRPFVSDLDLLAMLHLEQALLAGAERSWAGELLLTGGRPLVEVDPDRLDDAFGVTAELAYFRNGEWRRTP